MKKILLIVIALIAMMGTAAADDERIQVLYDGTNTPNIDNPLIIPNDGSEYKIDVFFDKYLAGTEAAGHNLTITITPLTGTLAAGEIQINCTEKDIGATTGTVTSAAGDVSVSLLYAWDQDNDGTASSNALTDTDTLDVSIFSTGSDNRAYQIQFSDIGGTVGNVIDKGLENRGINNVQEFPTIALPIAAILGLAFIIQRRREED